MAHCMGSKAGIRMGFEHTMSVQKGEAFFCPTFLSISQQKSSVNVFLLESYTFSYLHRKSATILENIPSCIFSFSEVS